MSSGGRGDGGDDRGRACNSGEGVDYASDDGGTSDSDDGDGGGCDEVEEEDGGNVAMMMTVMMMVAVMRMILAHPHPARLYREY